MTSLWDLIRVRREEAKARAREDRGPLTDEPSEDGAKFVVAEEWTWDCVRGWRREQ